MVSMPCRAVRDYGHGPKCVATATASWKFTIPSPFTSSGHPSQGPKLPTTCWSPSRSTMPSPFTSQTHGTPGHGRDHVLPAFISPSVTVPVQDGRMLLGTWQSVVLVDTNVDNPVRKVRLSFIAG